MSADLWTLAGLGVMSALAWMWGYLRGHEVADAMWRNRERARRSVDARNRHLSHRHERTPLTPAERAAFRRIADEEGLLP